MYSDDMKHFQDRFFMAISLTGTAYAKICGIKIGQEYKCTYLFRKFWSQGHFLMGNELYVYREDDLSQEEIYLKKLLVAFSIELGYVWGVIPQGESSKRQLNGLLKLV